MSRFWRLQTVAPDLLRDLLSSSDEQLRSVSAAIAEWAVEQVDVQDARLFDGLAALRAGIFGDSEARAGVQLLVDELDRVGFQVRELAEGSEGTLRAENETSYLVAFGRARAADSVWCALDTDPLFAAVESAYEARGITGEIDGVRSEIATVLATSR